MDFPFDSVFVPNQAISTVWGTVSTVVVNIGELVLPTGEIVASEPHGLDIPPPFSKKIKPGRYPVLLSIGETDKARWVTLGIKIVINQNPAVRWELAELKDSKTPAGEKGYYASSGIGCFMDQSTVNSILASTEIWTFGYNSEFTNGNAALIEKMLEEMNKSSDDRYNGVDWCTVTVDPQTEANMICFSCDSGGDRYKSYFGFTEDGTIAELITEFNIVGEKYDIQGGLSRLSLKEPNS